MGVGVAGINVEVAEGARVGVDDAVRVGVASTCGAVAQPVINRISNKQGKNQTLELIRTELIPISKSWFENSNALKIHAQTIPRTL